MQIPRWRYRRCKPLCLSESNSISGRSRSAILAVSLMHVHEGALQNPKPITELLRILFFRDIISLFLLINGVWFSWSLLISEGVSGFYAALSLDLTFAVVLLHDFASATVSEHLPKLHLPGNNCFWRSQCDIRGNRWAEERLSFSLGGQIQGKSYNFVGDIR